MPPFSAPEQAFWDGVHFITNSLFFYGAMDHLPVWGRWFRLCWDSSAWHTILWYSNTQYKIPQYITHALVALLITQRQRYNLTRWTWENWFTVSRIHSHFTGYGTSTLNTLEYCIDYHSYYSCIHSSTKYHSYSTTCIRVRRDATCSTGNTSRYLNYAPHKRTSIIHSSTESLCTLLQDTHLSLLLVYADTNYRPKGALHK